MSLWKWSRTAASNATADGSINWAEGQAPSSVNDSARALMAAAAKYRDDIAGAIATGGSSTAYTVTSWQVFDTLAHMDGAMIAFTPHTTSGATVTLNVDGLGAKPLRFSPSGVELPAGTLVQGTPYVATYYNATAEWILQGFAGNPYAIPLGGLLPYVGATAPNGSFVLPFGQAISRTTYASLFTLVSTTFGVGDGATTFNVPDLRGRVLAGKDDMGGVSANRLTNQTGGLDGDTLGATGGAETHTLTEAQLAAHTHGGVTGAGTAHAHDIMYNRTGAVGGANFNAVDLIDDSASEVTGQSEDESAHTHSIASAGSGTAHNNVQPTIIVNWILRVL